MTDTRTNRRQFIKTSAAAAIAAPTIIPASARGADGTTAPSERVNMGYIGIGNRGYGVMQAFLNHSDVQGLAVSDIYDKHFGKNSFDKGRMYGRQGGKEVVEKKYAEQKESGTWKGCEAYGDYRELLARDDIDAVMVATPDHWHALITMEALRHGKDVYCEKPVTHFFSEGKAVYEEVAKQEAVFCVGSQQRSDPKFRLAVNLVRNGVIGKVSKVEVGLPGGKTEYEMDATMKEAPEGYDMWCGPSPVLPYTDARHHWSWRWHTNYGRGQLMDWIGHHGDIAHWGIGMENSGPTRVEAKNWDYSTTLPLYDTANKYMVHCEYEGGIELSMGTDNTMGTKWIGEEGWVYVTRGKIEASNPAWLEEGFDYGEWEAYRSPGHQRNFVDCVKNRTEGIAPAENGHRSITPGHIAYVSHELGKPLQWDPAKEEIVGDADAQKILTALPYRGDWKL